MVRGPPARARGARVSGSGDPVARHDQFAEWHVTVQNRLPGRPLVALDGPMLDEALRLVELQADAGIPAGDRDFTGYVANVLFDDWDEVWADAPGACAAAGPLCARLRRWLRAGLGAAAAASRLRSQRPEPVEHPDRRGTDHRRGGLG